MRAPGRRGLVVGLFVAALTAAGLVAGTATASAHAVLERTDPPASAVLAARPARVSLSFGESVQLPPHAIRVYDPSGAEIDTGGADHPGGAPRTVGIGLRPGTTPGSYTVAWRVVSADTHPVSGAYVFSVGHPSATAAPSAPPGGSPTVGVLYAAVRAAAFAGYAALVGGTALILLCWPPGPLPAAVVTVPRAGWVTLLPATVATLLLQGPYGDGTGLTRLFAPGTVTATLQLPLGGALAARLLLLAGYPFYLRLLTFDRAQPVGAASLTAARRSGVRLVGVVLAGALAATWSLAGHAAVGRQPEIALPADIAHLMAMATWLGGVGSLAFVLWSADGRLPALAGALRRFSGLAQACVVVVAGTGVYQTWRQLGSWAALLDTSYARLLDLKLLAVATILAAAVFSRRTARSPAPVPATLRRSLAVEVAAAAVALALTAMLVNAEPGRTALAAHPPTSGPQHVTLGYDTGEAGGRGRLTVDVAPVRPGPNTLAVTVRRPDGVSVDVAELDVALILPAQHLGPLRVPVVHRGTGTYTASPQIPLPGDWELAVTVRTSDFDETTVRTPLPVG